MKTTAVRSGLDGLVDKSGFSKVLGKVGVSKVSSLLAGLVYVFVLLVFIVAAADAMHLTGVTNAISALFALPTFFTALAIFLAGLWGAELVKEAIGTMMDSVGLSGGRVLGSVVFGLIVLFTSITALNMAGVDTTLVTSNIVVVLGGILIAFCIAYGFAARDILTNILSSYYGKDRFKVGMRVRIGSDEGVIEKIDSISIAIRTADRLVLLPTKQLITERIEVLGEEAAG
ncbi:MAG: mechanosensitive ion channel [Flavobacteriales bacterium]|nr:mechanosensitive ion channel [Flavobacteriales bacterium]